MITAKVSPKADKTRTEKYLVLHAEEVEPAQLMASLLQSQTDGSVEILSTQLQQNIEVEGGQDDGEDIYKVTIEWEDMDRSGKPKMVRQRYYVCAENAKAAGDKIVHTVFSEADDGNIQSIVRTPIKQLLKLKEE